MALSTNKQEALVWNDLKNIHLDAGWNSGIYEKEKYIDTIFQIAEGKGESFLYMIYEGNYHCRVKILNDFPVDLTTEVFILAAHFNNLLTNGVVVVNVSNRYVEYQQKKDLLIPLLYTGVLYDQLIRHYNVSKDIYAAFQRLLIENESPAIIIADLLRDNDKKNAKNADE